MITPPALGRLTSPFGMRDGTLHDGQDFAAPAGTPIWAAWPGTVAVAQTLHPGWGNQVILDHGLVDGQRTLTRYAHLLNPPPVHVGQVVAAGERIGAMGTTGHSTGVHLHFGVYHGDVANYGTAVDPAPFLAARERAIMALDPRRGADWSRAEPTLAQLDRDGIAFCVRYVLDAARDSGKRLTLAEARLLTSWGRRIVANFEYEVGRMAQGFDAGVADAKVAVAECKALGMPRGRPIYASDDTGSTPAASIVAYLNGFNSVTGPAGYQTGYYGGYRGVDTAHKAGYRWLWQAAAWSTWEDPPGSGNHILHWHPAALVRQVRNGAFSGWDGDLNTAVVDDFGQWDTTGWTPTGDDMTPEEHTTLMGIYGRVAEVYPIKAALLSLVASFSAYVKTEQADDLAKAQAVADFQTQLADLRASVTNIPGSDPAEMARMIAAILGPEQGKQLVAELARELGD
jgi:hypothetical protein